MNTSWHPDKAGSRIGVLAGALLKHLSSSGSILCFHSLTSPAAPSASVVNISLEDLRRTLDVVAAQAEIIPLRELIERHQRGKSTARLCALTFDDAYVSVLTVGQAVLAGAGVPTTVFVTSAASRGGTAFWWDRVDDAAERTPPSRWRRFTDDLGVSEAYWRGQPPEFGPVRPLRQWLLAEHRGRWPDAFEPTLAALEVETGWRTAHRAMTFGELDVLTRTGLVDIGVHTITHPVLPLLSGDELVAEIRDCWQELRDRCRGVVPILAAPFGLYDERTLRLARDAGMAATLALGNRTLLGVAPDGVLPRLSMTRQGQAWKLRLRLSSSFDAVRRRFSQSNPASNPALPSATT